MQTLAHTIAHTILSGFDRHIRIFSRISQTARLRFAHADWQGVQHAAKERTDFYDKRVNETLKLLEQSFHIAELDSELWQATKRAYVELLKPHLQADLAETFYNSVFCKLFERKYYNNNYIFVETSLAKRRTRAETPIYTRYQPSEKGLRETVKDILTKPHLDLPFEDLDRDINNIITAFRERADKTMFDLSLMHFDILDSIFYRNKGAYLIGRVRSPAGDTPFIVALLNNEDANNGQGAVYIDALLTSSEEMAVVFGFARAYFFVECVQPCALVHFLHKLMPNKTKAELYSSIGFHKQGKTQFYRDFLHHLDNSQDNLELAPGIKGMVMSVFTLPSYPYVFKIIKDKFAPSKHMTKKDVIGKYRLVKLHDRVGRMADTMEYSEVAFPKDRFSEELLEELTKVAGSIIRFEDDLVIIKHVYIERRMTPLNLYLASASKEGNQEAIDSAMYGYGKAIKQLIAADIFPGDMLLKNFGVTRHGRVIFYDYDEITYMNEVNFRVKPEPKTEEQIFAAEPWYSVAPGDVFPEELATFALANRQYREAFNKHHANLLEASYWQARQRDVAQGIIGDVFPYPKNVRFNQAQALSE